MNWVNKDYIGRSNIKAFYLFDNDKSENQTKVKEINEKNNKNKARTTKFREMENYFSPVLVEKYFDITFSEEEKMKWEKKDIAKLVKQKKGISHKDIKSKMNKKLVQKISKATLEEMRAWDEVQCWFKTMKNMYDEG